MIFKILVVTCVGLGFMACSEAKLMKPKVPDVIYSVPSGGEFCTKAPSVNNRYTKFLFVVDKSGSNNQSDPQNAKRADNIEAFYEKHKTNQFMKWGLITFQDSSADAQINDGKGTQPTQNPIFTTDPAKVYAGLQQERSLADQGATPYRSSMSLVRKAIKDDIKAFPTEESLYMIFFMSDGRPTDYGGGQDTAQAAAVQDVEDIMKISPGRIYFSTLFYNVRPDQPAADGLKKMADAGKGKFVDSSKGDPINFDDLIVGGIVIEPWQIKHLLVYNVNSAICFDNKFGADSDGDGLCDKDEIQLKKDGKGEYDPQNRYSFGDAYNDYIHYIVSMKADSKLTKCDIYKDDDNDLLNNCEETYMLNSNPAPGINRNNDDPLNPDSDGDGVIDGIEYLMLKSKAAGLDWKDVFKSYDREVETAGEQIQQHRNPLFPDADLQKEEIYDTKWELMGYNAEGQSCYKFTQKILPTYSTLKVDADKTLPYLAHGENENIVLIYFIQTPERDPEGKGTYMYSFQTIKAAAPDQHGFKVSDSIFNLYVVPSL